MDVLKVREADDHQMPANDRDSEPHYSHTLYCMLCPTSMLSVISNMNYLPY